MKLFYMCWSENVSLMFTVIGAAATAYSYKYVDRLWALSVFYFTIMQLIHYISYLVINECDNPVNIAMAYTNYVHVAFQPFFYLLGLYGLFKTYKTINKDQLVSLRYFIYISVFFGVFYAARLFPIQGPSETTKGSLKTTGCTWCGPPCAVSGKQHVDLSVPLRLRPYYFTPGIFSHFFLIFIPPLLYNTTTRIVSLFMLISASIPAMLYNLTPSESGTTWCGISIAQLIILMVIVIYYKK